MLNTKLGFKTVVTGNQWLSVFMIQQSAVLWTISGDDISMMTYGFLLRWLQSPPIFSISSKSCASSRKHFRPVGIRTAMQGFQ